MKELGVYTRFKCNTVQSVIAFMKDVHKTRLIEQQQEELAQKDAEIKKYQFMLNSNGDTIVYRGHVIPYSSRERAYCINLGGKKHKISKGNVEKLQKLFDVIDLFED